MTLEAILKDELVRGTMMKNKKSIFISTKQIVINEPEKHGKENSKTIHNNKLPFCLLLVCVGYIASLASGSFGTEVVSCVGDISSFYPMVVKKP